MARITFEVTQEQHTYIKMMAASKGISIRDYFLQQMEKSLPVTDGKKISRRTRKVLEKTDRHQNLHFTANVNEFYSELGLTKYLVDKPAATQPKLLKSLPQIKKVA